MVIKDSEYIDLATPKGAMRTHIFRPIAPGKYPGLVLFSEIFQVTGPIRRTAAMLAGHGYVVAVPEIFHELEPIGCVIPYDAAGADKGNADKVAKELSSYDADARAVLAHLKSLPYCTGKLGSIGICIGGHLSFRCSMNPEVLAGVCFYATDIHKRSLGLGMKDNTLDRVSELKAEMLMIWGRQDPHVPPEGRALIYNALHEANASFTWHEFNGQHAFLRDEGYRYDPALAHLCVTLVLELFHRKLGQGDLPIAQASASGETKH
ncbi:MAG TPA: dienelactone hydrolase family protein [Planctomycetota bacterium]|nr:dienelactone hydrolase family protein [Planctomycetota bacterium]